MYSIISLISAIFACYAFFNAEKVIEFFEYSIRNLRKKAEYVKRQEEGKLKVKGDGNFGEKFIKRLKNDKIREILFKSLSRNVFKSRA